MTFFVVAPKSMDEAHEFDKKAPMQTKFVHTGVI